MTGGDLLGPLAALALALTIIGAFMAGKLLPRSTVPREDYEKLAAVNASYAEALPLLTKAVNDAIAIAREERAKNGGP